MDILASNISFNIKRDFLKGRERKTWRPGKISLLYSLRAGYAIPHILHIIYDYYQVLFIPVLEISKALKNYEFLKSEISD